MQGFYRSSKLGPKCVCAPLSPFLFLLPPCLSLPLPASLTLLGLHPGPCESPFGKTLLSLTAEKLKFLHCSWMHYIFTLRSLFLWPVVVVVKWEMCHFWRWDLRSSFSFVTESFPSQSFPLTCEMVSGEWGVVRWGKGSKLLCKLICLIRWKRFFCIKDFCTALTF